MQANTKSTKIEYLDENGLPEREVSAFEHISESYLTILKKIAHDDILYYYGKYIDVTSHEKNED